MNINDPTIVDLREKVRAAQEVFELAVTLHEVWKPAAHDEELHKRLGVSYATQAFNVVRVALRREMVLALMRLWDNDPRAIGMQSIAKTIADVSIIDTIASDRVSRMNISGVDEEIKRTLRDQANSIIVLVSQYADGGAKAGSFKKLRAFRNQRLAHTPSEDRCYHRRRCDRRRNPTILRGQCQADRSIAESRWRGGLRSGRPRGRLRILRQLLLGIGARGENGRSSQLPRLSP